MDFDNDPALVAEMKRLADSCEFRVVKAYFRDPAWDVYIVILVQPGFALEEIAASLAGPRGEEVEPDGAHKLDLLKAMVEVGAIKLGVDDIRGVLASHTDEVVLLDSIPDHQRCDVILLPPIYVVKLEKEYLCVLHNYELDEKGHPMKKPEINCQVCRGMGFFSEKEIQEFLSE